MTESFTGVVDRIVDEKFAVILLESGGEVTDELSLELTQLPEQVAEGDVLTVRLEDGEFASATIQEDETEGRKADAKERFDRLSTSLSEENESDSN